jgi:predicted aconitase with swiveling domain
VPDSIRKSSNSSRVSKILFSVHKKVEKSVAIFLAEPIPTLAVGALPRKCPTIDAEAIAEAVIIGMNEETLQIALSDRVCRRLRQIQAS